MGRRDGGDGLAAGRRHTVIIFQLVRMHLPGLGQLGLTCRSIQALYARYSGRHDVYVYDLSLEQPIHLTGLLMMACCVSTFLAMSRARRMPAGPQRTPSIHCATYLHRYIYICKVRYPPTVAGLPWINLCSDASTSNRRPHFLRTGPQAELGRSPLNPTEMRPGRSTVTIIILH